jgi:hypothetical protein
MIAHIRQSKQQESPTPIIRARQMVAETLLSDLPAKRHRRTPLRKILVLGGLALLAMAAVLGYLWLR